jgi:hypothetical protein
MQPKHQIAELLLKGVYIEWYQKIELWLPITCNGPTTVLVIVLLIHKV